MGFEKAFDSIDHTLLCSCLTRKDLVLTLSSEILYNNVERYVMNNRRSLGCFTQAGNTSRRLLLIQLFLQRTCEANPAGENSSSILTVCVKSIPLYHVKVGYVVLHIRLSKNLLKPTSKNREIGRFDRSLLIESF